VIFIKMQKAREEDWSIYKVSELIAALKDANKTAYSLIPSKTRLLGEPGAHHDVIVQKIQKGAHLSVYNYIQKEVKIQTRLTNVDLPSMALARNIEIQTVAINFMGVHSPLGSTVPLSSVVVSEPDKWVECTPVHESMPESLVLRLPESIIVAPLHQGDPVVPKIAKEALADAGVIIDTVLPREITTAQAIVDLMVHDSKDGLKPKPLSPYISIFARREREREKLLIMTTSALMEELRTRTKGSMKGRDLYKVLVSILVSNRLSSNKDHVDAYKDFIASWTSWVATRSVVQRPRKIGDYPSGTLEYSRLLLNAMRGIRGGDDKDSTAVGYSTYLPINIPRAIVKCLVRAFDVVQLMALYKASTVGFVGSEAKKYIEALIAVNPNSVKTVFGPQGIYPGWTENQGIYVSDHHKFVIDTLQLGGEIIIDTEYVATPKCINVAQMAKTKYIRFIDTPLDFASCDRFVPSVSTHNLKGFLLPPIEKDADGGKLVIAPKIPDTYLNCVDTINIARTYPGHYHVRAYEIQRKNKISGLSLGVLWKYMKTAQAVGFETMAQPGAYCVDDLREFMDDSQIKRLDTHAQAVLSAAVADDDQFESVEPEDDDSEEYEDRQSDEDLTEEEYQSKVAAWHEEKRRGKSGRKRGVSTAKKEEKVEKNAAAKLREDVDSAFD